MESTQYGTNGRLTSDLMERLRRKRLEARATYRPLGCPARHKYFRPPQIVTNDMAELTVDKSLITNMRLALATNA